MWVGLFLGFVVPVAPAVDQEAGNSGEMKEDFRQAFADPPNEFRIVQYGNPTPKQIEVYRDFGIGGFMAFFHDHLRNPPHPRHQDPAGIGPMIEAAKAGGFQLWLADDYGYPSGMAGGRVVEDHPEFEVRGLFRAVTNGTGRVRTELQLPDDTENIVVAVIHPMADGRPGLDLAQAVDVDDPRRVATGGMDGPWRLSVFAVRPLQSDTQAQSTMAQFQHSGRYPDLMNPAATDAFIERMHQRIEAAAGGLGGKVEGFYSNEPNLMQMPWDWSRRDARPYPTVSWNAGLPAEFRRRNGYDLIPRLSALFEGGDRDSRRVRMHFHRTVADLTAAAYTDRIAAWCEARGLRAGGHCLLEERLPMHVACYGDMMKFAAGLHVPSFDIGIPNPDRIASFPYSHVKLFSGVASWKNRDTVIALPDPIIEGGGHKRLSPAIPLLRNVINRVFLHGGNLITSYTPLHPRNTESEKAAGYSPDEYRALNEYVGRLAVMLRGARQETAVALYYPIADFQADYIPSGKIFTLAVEDYKARQAAWDDTERALLDADVDFTILHPEALLEADIDGGRIRSGRGAFRYLVMPGIDTLSLGLLEKIRSFEAGGGVTLWVGSKPSMGESAAEDDELNRAFASTPVIAAKDLPVRIPAPYDPSFALAFDAGASPVSIARYRRNDMRIHILVNRGREPARVGVRSDASGIPELFDPASGRITILMPPATIQIPDLGSQLIVERKGG